MSRGLQDVSRVTLTAAFVAFAVAACSSKNGGNAGAGASAGGTAGAAGPSASARTSGNGDTSRSSTSSGADSLPAASSDIAQMSDSNIVAKLDASDKGEVELARLMETKATSDSVKSYARTLVTDHTKSEQQVQTLERQLKLAEKPLKSDTTRQNATHVFTRFRGMPKGAATDSAFVQHEIEDHQHDIADARAMASQAKDPQLKQLIQESLPVLGKHLDMARQLSHQNGRASTGG